jgi:hypothetical protein
VVAVDPRSRLSGGGDGKGILENLGGAAQIAWALTTPFLRNRRIRWGATDEELRRIFPGDSVVPHPRWQFLHAITVDAPAEAVWPWIAQIGQGRGGFYSYQVLENLLGCAIENAGAVRAEWQRVVAGDAIKLHAKAPPLRVALVEPGHALVLCSDLVEAKGKGPLPSQGHVNVSWAFVVESIHGSRSRLFSRDRADYGPGLVTRLSYGPAIVEPLSFVMDRKMLRGIQWRAERRWRQGPLALEGLR